jgi:hypothetical protein
LLGALVSGLAAAQAICASDTAAAMDCLVGSQADVNRIYELRRLGTYRQEKRWPHSPFWSDQHI